jgi:hypothetical protein
MPYHSGKPSILNSVPIEILREIASALGSANDRSALSQTSRLLNMITIPVLFRNIHLDNVAKALECFDILAKNPKRPDYVRSLTIEIQTSSGCAKCVISLIIEALTSVFKGLHSNRHNIAARGRSEDHAPPGDSVSTNP